MRILISLLLAASPVWAECPPVTDRQAELDALVVEANAAPNEAVGRQVSDKMWTIWFDAPDDTAQALLERGMIAARGLNFIAAVETYGRLIDYCPEYAEGYNQRAFAYFLNGEFTLAEADLGAALAREPRHVGALTGLAHTLRALGREDEAQVWLKKAVALNPWVPERRLLDSPPTQDL